MPPRPRASQQSQSSQSSRTSAKRPKTLSSTLNRLSTLPVVERSSQPPRKKLKPSISIARAPVVDLTTLSDEVEEDDDVPTAKLKAVLDLKGKSKSSETTADDRLWVDKFEPTTEAELAIHPRKVADVRQWLMEALVGGPGGKLRKYRRILALTGPAGTGKTAVLRVLARELGLDILEWRNTVGETFQDALDNDDGYNSHVPQESLASKFSSFLARASSCHSVFGPAPSPTNPSFGANLSQLRSQPPTQPTRSRSSSKLSSHTVSSHPSSSQLPSTPLPSDASRHVILLEDLPNLLHARTQSAVQSALEAFLASPVEGAAPLVLIVSDAGMRGENPDERAAADLPSAGASRVREAIDIRTVLPPEMLRGPYVTQIGFNPVASTYMRRALSAVASATSLSSPPSRDIIERIVEAAEGDIRAVVNALQFACVADKKSKSTRGGKNKGGPNARALLESVTRREHSMALFHLLGRILYNKRKGDPPSSGLSKKDAEKDRLADAALPDSPLLPDHLAPHTRRTSKVDVDALYADSPVDASLLGLYLHQNFVPFCNDLEHCDGVADALSYVDASSGELWHQANPHRFHLLTRGTLHALPSPVPRRGQRTFKPAWFERLHQERAAADAIRDTQDWLHADGIARASGGWKRKDIVLELGGVLRARAAQASKDVPTNHEFFSTFAFDADEAGPGELAEEDAADAENSAESETANPLDGRKDATIEDDRSDMKGGWLEGDEIDEDWD